MPQSPKIAIVEPPLALSRHFVDYPWLNLLAACQMGAVLRDRGARVQVLDGLSPGGLDNDGEGLWLEIGRAHV